jgi:hypothetical protein
MIRIAISQAAFEAVVATLAHGLEPRVVDRLRYLRGPGESYSDVILRLVEMEPWTMNARNSPHRQHTIK